MDVRGFIERLVPEVTHAASELPRETVEAAPDDTAARARLASAARITRG